MVFIDTQGNYNNLSGTADDTSYYSYTSCGDLTCPSCGYHLTERGKIQLTHIMDEAEKQYLEEKDAAEEAERLYWLEYDKECWIENRENFDILEKVKFSSLSVSFSKDKRHRGSNRENVGARNFRKL